MGELTIKVSTLKRLYIEEKKPVVYILEALAIDSNTFYRLLKQAKIPTRNKHYRKVTLEQDL